MSSSNHVARNRAAWSGYAAEYAEWAPAAWAAYGASIWAEPYRWVLEADREWARRWPSEQSWVAQKTG